VAVVKGQSRERLQFIADVLNGERRAAAHYASGAASIFHGIPLSLDLDQVPMMRVGEMDSKELVLLCEFSRWRHAGTNERAEGYQVFQNTLRRLVESWLEARRDFPAWVERNPELNKAVNGALYRMREVVVPFRGRASLWRVRLPLPEAREGEKTWLVRHEAVHDACATFLDLVTASNQEDFKRCERCARYFADRPNKVYCSMRCGSTLRAKLAMAQRRRQEREAKLREVKRACREWRRRHRLLSREGPRRWIAERAGVTLSWLSRHRKELKLPKEIQVR
jgi:hypothetical protein